MRTSTTKPRPARGLRYGAEGFGVNSCRGFGAGFCAGALEWRLSLRAWEYMTEGCKTWSFR